MLRPYVLRRRFLTTFWSVTLWLALTVVDFILLGNISYLSLSFFLLPIIILVAYEYKMGEVKRFLLPALLLLLTIIMHFPLFFPGFVTIEKEGFYEVYPDGSGAYTPYIGDHCINCPDPTFIPLRQGDKFLIIGYNYDSNIGGTREEIRTFIGSFEDHEIGRGYISISDPSLLTNIFFWLQRRVDSMFVPLAFF